MRKQSQQPAVLLEEPVVRKPVERRSSEIKIDIKQMPNSLEKEKAKSPAKELEEKQIENKRAEIVSRQIEQAADQTMAKAQQAIGSKRTPGKAKKFVGKAKP